MSRYFEEAHIADCVPIVVLAKVVLLHITHTLHYEAYREEYYAGNVPACAERVLRVLRDVGGVQNGYWEGDCPHPYHLEDPEAEEGEELVALVIESVV